MELFIVLAVAVAFVVIYPSHQPMSPRLRNLAHRLDSLPLLRSLVPLVVAGTISELVYLLYFVGQFSLPRWLGASYIDLGSITNHTQLGFILFIGAFSVVFLLFGLAWRFVRDRDDRQTLLVVFGFGALFALTMTFVYPITALDSFLYYDESLIMAQYHQNPIFMAPAAFPHDPLMTLSASFYGTTAPYGPLALIVDALPTFIAGRNVLASLILLKIMWSGVILVEAFLVCRILQRTAPRQAITGALLVAWNPLLLYEVSGHGHNDILMMLFVTLAVLSLMRQRFALALVLLVASMLVKYVTGLLVPLFLLYGLTHCATHRQRIRFVVLGVLASIALVAVVYAPFWQGIATLSNALSQGNRYNDSFSSTLGSIFTTGVTLQQAAALGRILFVPVYLYALWLSSRRLPDLVRGSFLVMVFFLIIATSVSEPWYAVWPIILAALAPGVIERLSVLLLAYGAELGYTLYIYIWPWLGLGDPNSFRIIDIAVYSITFVPATVALLGYMVWRSEMWRNKMGLRIRVSGSKG